MGIVTSGIPREIVRELAALGNCNAFVETGTFQGGTTRWAAEHFDVVHTIERAQVLFDRFSSSLSALPGVITHLGDSKVVLPKVMAELPASGAVLWLDGHWSGDETAGEGDECPVIEELACLSSRPNDIVLIDDARLFLAAPPQPHRAEQWPTLSDIVRAMDRLLGPRFLQVIDDVIYIVPDTIALRARLVAHAQERSAVFWQHYLESQRGSEASGPLMRWFSKRRD